MLDTALNSITNLGLRGQMRNDDQVNQLHHFITVTILVFFAAITGFMEYGSQPISCWNYGNYVLGHYQDHVNKYCWDHTLYRYPNHSDWSVMPYELDDRGFIKNLTILDKKSKDEMGAITPSRLITLFFIIQAFSFKLPHVFWTEFNSSLGSNIMKMVEMLEGVLFPQAEEKKEKLKQVALFLEHWLLLQPKPYWLIVQVKKTFSARMLCMGPNARLSIFYLQTKVFFLINNVMQFMVVSFILRINSWAEVLQVDFDEDMMATNTAFPTVVLCHFKTYDKREPLGIWVQCILSINNLLETLLFLEWLWLLILLFVTFIDFCIWCYRMLRTQRISFVKKYINLLGVNSEPQQVPERCSVEKFVTRHLGYDGVFLLRILFVNTNEVAVAQLVEELWTRYLTKENDLDITEPSAPSTAEIPSTVETPSTAETPLLPIPAETTV